MCSSRYSTGPPLRLNLVTERADENGRLRCSPRTAVSIVKAITLGHGQPRAVWAERKRGDTSIVFLVLPESLFGSVVPDGDGAVRAGRGEGMVAKTRQDRGEHVYAYTEERDGRT